MVKISVVIITFNEEKNLARCLQSAQAVADEIIVVDSNSTDNTQAVAQKYNAQLIQHEFAGYGQQKNFATQQASYNWILSLDADEALSEQLTQSILAIKNNPEYDVYQMPRVTNYCGKWIRHSGWYPDKQTRMYNRTKGRWIEKKVHEYWAHADISAKKGTLSGDLLHYSFNSVSEHLKKIEKYTELAATEAVANGRNTSFLKIIIGPRWHFFSNFFLKLGFLDGYSGYIVCRLSAYAAFVKYSKIYLLNKAAGKNE